MAISYQQLFEQRRVVDQEGRSLADEFDSRTRWLSSIGCFVQSNNERFSTALSSESVVKPGILISIVLKGLGHGGPWGGTARLHYSDNTLAALALRQPTRWWGQIPRGTYIQTIGLAFPSSSIRRLNLWEEFEGLFGSAKTDFVVMTTKAGPRLQAIAAEMLSPPLNGNLSRLLLEAHAIETLAHAMSALAGGAIPAITFGDRMRLQSLCNVVNDDLQHNWSLAELAKQAGLSKRTLSAKFRAAFGMTVFDYLKQQRLAFARDALVHQRLTVSEAAYRVGYESPANFATAFRRYYGIAPSACRRQGRTP